MFSFKAILGVLFMLLVVTIAILAIVCFRANLETVEASQEVSHTHQVVGKVDAISAACKDLQLSVYRRRDRGVDTEAASAVLSSITELRDITHGNHLQRKRIDSLDRAVRKWTGLWDPAGGAGIDPVLRGIETIRASEETLLKQQRGQRRNFEGFPEKFYCFAGVHCCPADIDIPRHPV
ncbi:CHASE3 domain-containing protein [Dawidia soli]|uniref:Uncharacterized protein n=1 Tax=Dawidia soli TaxID=2782352 RepID=A0AAP2D6U9_9BACT|nr:CHASE3 domain-containing protein [Dawidia soli]MBT1686458.1 hypothetical protein [Dawidia soli]